MNEVRIRTVVSGSVERTTRSAMIGVADFTIPTCLLAQNLS
jgi:hypothetical protein